MSHNWPYGWLAALTVSLMPILAFAQQGVPIGPIGVSNSVGPGGGFPITIGSTSVAAGSTTTAITGMASLGITAPTANSAALTVSGASHTGTDATSDVSIATTWNTSGVLDAAKIVVTDTAHGALSSLFSLYGGASGTTKEIAVSTIGTIVARNGFISADPSSSVSAGGLDAGATTTALGLGSNWKVAWTSNSNNGSAGIDTGLSRDAAGIIDVDTGTAGNKAGSMKMTNLTASGTITFAGVTTGTNADFACFAAGGVMTLQTSACTISSLRFKNLLGNYRSDPLDAIASLRPIVFTMKGENPDWNYDKPQIGLSAENVAAVEPRCAIYEQDGITPKSYRQECIIAIQTAAIARLEKKVSALEHQ